MNYRFIVLCKECSEDHSEEHSVEDVKVLNVEENIHGQDVCFFECPITNQVTKSLVYREIENANTFRYCFSCRSHCKN